MSPLDIQRKILDMKRLDTAKAEMELKIAERLAEIDRIQNNVKIQEAAIQKIKDEFVASGVPVPAI